MHSTMPRALGKSANLNIWQHPVNNIYMYKMLEQQRGGGGGTVHTYIPQSTLNSACMKSRGSWVQNVEKKERRAPAGHLFASSVTVPVASISRPAGINHRGLRGTEWCDKRQVLFVERGNQNLLKIINDYIQPLQPRESRGTKPLTGLISKSTPTGSGVVISPCWEILD